MAERSSDRHKRSFNLDGVRGPVGISAGSGSLEILDGDRNIAIEEESLLRIEYLYASWRFGSSEPSLRIRFLYRVDQRLGKAEIALAADNPGTIEFVDFLKRRYPDKASFGPDEVERGRVLSADYHGAYGLHALDVLTPAGILTGFLLACALALSILIAEPTTVRAVSGKALLDTLFIFLGLALVPASLVALITARILMVLRTDSGGLTVRRIFGSARFAWQDIHIGEACPDDFNVYTGMFCYYSDRITVVSSRRLLEIPVMVEGRAAMNLKMNIEEAAAFIRELYYRGKVSLATAEKTGAFL